MFNSQHQPTNRQDPTFNQMRNAIIEAVASEYAVRPLGIPELIEGISQASALAPMVELSPTEYIRCAIAGLTQAGAPRSTITAMNAYLMEVIRAND